MTVHDPIGDFLTSIRNAKEAEHRFVDVALSKMKVEIAKVLKEQGFIENYIVSEERRKMRLFLRYAGGRKSVIQGLKRVSKPGLRRYVQADHIPHVLQGMGIAILSTSQGIFDGERARKQKVGGELLCYVW